jgi:class 3 adenylate cyclase
VREQVIDPAVAGHNGRIVKLTGDGALVLVGIGIAAWLRPAHETADVAEEASPCAGGPRGKSSSVTSM